MEVGEARVSTVGLAVVGVLILFLAGCGSAEVGQGEVPTETKGEVPTETSSPETASKSAPSTTEASTTGGRAQPTTLEETTAAEETSDTNVTVTGGNTEGSSASAANAESPSASAANADAQKIVQAANAAVVKGWSSQTVDIDNSKTTIKYNSDNSAIVAVYFNSSRDGPRVAYMYVAKDANGQYVATLLYQGPPSEANATKPSQDRQTWILRGSQDFYPLLVNAPDRIMGKLTDAGSKRYQDLYGNGQLKQLMAGQTVQGKDVKITAVQDNKVTVVATLQPTRIDSGRPVPVGQPYQRNIVWIRDPAIGVWLIDSFDPISAS